MDNLEIIDRQPASKKFRDLSGTKSEHGIEFVKLVGFYRKHPAYECICPSCGRHFLMSSHMKAKQKTCGEKQCKHHSAVKLEDRRVGQLRSFYKRAIYPHIVDPESAWGTFEGFLGSIPSDFDPSTHFIMQTVMHLPLSVANYQIIPRTRRGQNCRSRVWLIEGYWIDSYRAAQILGITRQAVHIRYSNPRTEPSLVLDLQAMVRHVLKQTGDSPLSQCPRQTESS